MKATNRQKKLLSFFKVRYSPNISAGAAGWEIGAIMQDEECREHWRRYLYLTKDFDSDSPALKPFDEAQLQSVEIPEDWSASEAMQQFRDEVIAGELADSSPFDQPQPAVEFTGKSFMFTGKFSFGTRKECQTAVVERGGYAPSQKSVCRETDYLVIGTEGSKTWKRGSYGNKIEAAILSRREHGTPAIISEEHWVSQIGKG
jgi:NAD-dependent DNA ligase